MKKLEMTNTHSNRKTLECYHLHSIVRVLCVFDVYGAIECEASDRLLLEWNLILSFLSIAVVNVCIFKNTSSVVDWLHATYHSAAPPLAERYVSFRLYSYISDLAPCITLSWLCGHIDICWLNICLLNSPIQMPDKQTTDTHTFNYNNNNRPLHSFTRSPYWRITLARVTELELSSVAVSLQIFSCPQWTAHTQTHSLTLLLCVCVCVCEILFRYCVLPSVNNEINAE